MGILLTLVHAAQAALSANAAFHSYLAISNLQQYEPATKKAATYSGTAEEQLHKTRTTQASGALAIVLSLATSTAFLFNAFPSTAVQLLLNVGNIAAALGARAHIRQFWEGKMKVPLVGGYNEGIRRSNHLVDQLGYLAISWVVGALLTLI